MPLEHYITKVTGPLHNQAAQVIMLLTISL